MLRKRKEWVRILFYFRQLFNVVLSGLVEQEERRIEALRKRQEKELNKIVEREQTMAQLQLKIKRAEEEEVKKKVGCFLSDYLI